MTVPNPAHFQPGIEVRSKGRHIAESHFLDLAVANFGFDGNQPRGRFQLEFRYWLGDFHHAGFNQHGHYANRVSARHGRIFHLLHDDEAGVGFRVRGRQDEVAVRCWISARLAQHAQADVVGMAFEVLHLFEHGLAGDIEDAAGDNAAGFAAGMGINRGDHARKAQDTLWFVGRTILAAAGFQPAAEIRICSINSLCTAP